ncbi:hypothetical protein IGI04_040827 [Brassica rapa subsp. trilocularis]|uniref:Uncharacterized protein n=1 Tax=Brassica rapa subsp. trilocularis TaxID=1813537 RepID=A0ABQ7KQA8_BRACM|nr:hypothetical protein IGI04_040827 [Brassica rapa subsp. trilocularis]
MYCFLLQWLSQSPMEAPTLEFRFIFFLWNLNFTSYIFIFFLKSSLISSSTIYIYRLLWSCKAVEESRFKKALLDFWESGNVKKDGLDHGL